MLKNQIISILTLFLLAISINAYGINHQANEYLRKARIEFGHGSYKTAEKYYLRAKELEPNAEELETFSETLYKQIDNHIRKLQQEAYDNIQKNNIAAAEKLYKELAIYCPDDQNIKYKLDELKRVKNELQNYQRPGGVLSLSSSAGAGGKGSSGGGNSGSYSAISYYNRAKTLFENGKYEQALELVEEILRRNSNHANAKELKKNILNLIELNDIKNRAESSFAKNSMSETISAINELLAKDSTKYQYYLMRGQAYLYQKEYNKALSDFWLYYRHAPNELKTITPYLVEAYAKNGNYLKALGFAFDKLLNQYIETNQSIWKLYFYAYFWQCTLLIALIFIVFPISIYYLWQTAHNLFFIFSFKILMNAIHCFYYLILDNNKNCVIELVELARQLNYYWLNYLTGLVLLDNNEVTKAQRLFQSAMNSRSLRNRALYFHGLTSKLLKASTFYINYQESVIISLDESYAKPWLPFFLRKIEKRLLTKYAIRQTVNYESLANKLILELN